MKYRLLKTSDIINFFITVILLTEPTLSFSQSNDIPLKGKSFQGALEFLPNGKIAEGHSRVKNTNSDGKDPLIDPNNWYIEGNSQIRGLVTDAVLFFEWWPKGSYPAERYRFDWVSSGYFEILAKTDNPFTPIKRINRSDLEKYPNLLKCFDNLRPFEAEFEINFRICNIPDQEYNDFRKKYSLFETLGNAGYSVSYTRVIKGDVILYLSSLKTQEWVNPGIISWDYFLDMPDKYQDKRTGLIELFRIGQSICINSFKIKSIKWRMSDFAYIANKLEAYNSGKEKPSVFDEVASGEKVKKAGDGSWDETDLVDSETEAFRDGNEKMGIKTKKGRVVKEGAYDNIVKSDKEKYYIASQGNAVYILNNMGSVVLTKNFNKSPSIGVCSNGEMWASVQTSNTQIGDFDYYMSTGEKYFFESGVQKKSIKWYNSYAPYKPGYLIVANNYNSREEREQAEREEKEFARQAEIRRKEMHRIANEQGSLLESQGYILEEKANCD